MSTLRTEGIQREKAPAELFAILSFKLERNHLQRFCKSISQEKAYDKSSHLSESPERSQDLSQGRGETGLIMTHFQIILCFCWSGIRCWGLSMFTWTPWETCSDKTSHYKPLLEKGHCLPCLGSWIIFC